MKVGIIAIIKSPHKTLQIKDICKNIYITIYCTKKGKHEILNKFKQGEFYG